jgi:hypothetical protein
MSLLIQLLGLVLPWPIRRLLLQRLLRWEIADGARIGRSVLLVGHVCLGLGSRIGHLTFAKGLSLLEVGCKGRIGNLNWITGASKGSKFFHDQPDRFPSLLLGDHASVTHRHLIDCTDSVKIGDFTTFGGWGSQILTHSIDVRLNRQRAAPVYIGCYCFVGTRVVLLKGAALPSYSVLSAGSVLARHETATHHLYSGNPASPVRALSEDLPYFQREVGYVD